MKTTLLRHLLNLKVLPTSKALKLYTPLSSTSTTDSFAFDVQTEAEKMYDEL
jgi:hypothetical protein